MPPYWKRGAVAGIAVWAIMSLLVSHLDHRNAKMIEEGNVPISVTTPKETSPGTERRQTDFGRLMGLLVFALFCVIPENPVYPNPPQKAPQESAPDSPQA